MAAYRVRDPGSFSPDFHRVINQGEGPNWLLTQRYTHSAVVADRFEWSVFLYSLRAFKSHPSAYWVDKLKYRTRIVRNPGMGGRWELRVTARRSVLEDMEFVDE